MVLIACLARAASPTGVLLRLPLTNFNTVSKYSNKEWLQKWLEGDLTRSEERELRQIAQSEPFLADALAGLESQPEIDHVTHLSNIEQRLAQRVPHSAKVRQLTPPMEKEEAKVVPIRGLDWRRIAAAVALLLVAAGGMWFIGQSDQMTQGVAMQQEESAEEVPAPSVANSDALEIESTPSNLSEPTDNQSIAAADPLPSTPKKSAAKAEKKAKSKVKSQAKEEVPTPTKRAKKQRESAPIAATTPPPAALEEAPARIAPEPYSATQGRIQAAPITEEAASIAASDAVMDESENEKMVEAQARRKANFSEARPVAGFPTLKKYLQKNLPNIKEKGRLKWIFQLDATGQPINVRVMEQPANGLSKVAKSLFEKGGKWIGKADDADAFYEYELKY